MCTFYLTEKRKSPGKKPFTFAQIVVGMTAVSVYGVFLCDIHYEQNEEEK